MTRDHTSFRSPNTDLDFGPGFDIGEIDASVASVRPCPGGFPEHFLLDLPDADARQAGLPLGEPAHVDRVRQPATGDLVWVELVRYGSTERPVRRYARDGEWVTLSAPGGGSAAVVRRPGELLILGVVDNSARCVTSAL